MELAVELRHLAAFVAVAEERHFGRAAKRLQIAQPPLSRQIQALERELGAALFDRRSRPLRLTPAGTAFLGEAQLTLEQARRAVERARRAGRGQIGRLSVGATPWAYQGVLPPILRDFSAGAPDVSLELFTLDVADQVDGLRESRLDVCFSPFAHRLTDERSLAFEPILEEPMIALVPDGHRFSSGAAVSLEDLATEPLVPISRSLAPELTTPQIELFHERGLTPTVRHEAPDVHAQLALIAAGLGVGLHFASFRNLRHRGVSFVPVLDSPAMALLLVWRRDDERRLLRFFIERAREVARSFDRQTGG